MVPIYQGQVRGCIRYTLVFHLNGQRTRHTFGSLQKAKAEAQLVAQRVQEGLSSSKDMSVSQRQCYLTLERMITPVNIPWLRPPGPWSVGLPSCIQLARPCAYVQFRSFKPLLFRSGRSEIFEFPLRKRVFLAAEIKAMA